MPMKFVILFECPLHHDYWLFSASSFIFTFLIALEMRISTQKSCKVPLFSYLIYAKRRKGSLCISVPVNMNGRRTNLASENYPKESAERYVWPEKILFYPFVNIC
ncbi:hypothetical protein V8G54_030889 [Vigna mungo]|uniref:Uncharacterized protein n=1 Tax=Vigna mungo TaxID=3915 RepID=A0AAQ3MX90_VIGMU